MSVPDKNDFIFAAAIDHRIDFIKDLVGDEGPVPSAASYEKAADLKGIVFAAIAKAVESGLPKSQVAIWTDPDVGEAVLLRPPHVGDAGDRRHHAALRRRLREAWRLGGEPSLEAVEPGVSRGGAHDGVAARVLRLQAAAAAQHVVRRRRLAAAAQGAGPGGGGAGRRAP